MAHPDWRSGVGVVFASDCGAHVAVFGGAERDEIQVVLCGGRGDLDVLCVGIGGGAAYVWGEVFCARGGVVLGWGAVQDRGRSFRTPGLYGEGGKPVLTMLTAVGVPLCVDLYLRVWLDPAVRGDLFDTSLPHAKRIAHTRGAVHAAVSVRIHVPHPPSGYVPNGELRRPAPERLLLHCGRGVHGKLWVGGCGIVCLDAKAGV